MRRSWLLAIALACVACSGLKTVAPDDQPDGGLGEADAAPVDGGSYIPGEDGGGPPDGDAGDAGPDKAPPCDGPCPAEDLLTGLPQASWIAIDNTNVYVATEASDAPIYQCPKTGCAGPPILLGKGYAFGIAVVGNFVHWGDYFTGKVWRCAVGGCGGSPVAIAVNQAQLRGVVTDGAKLYWSADDNILTCDPNACTPTVVRAGTGPIFSMAAALSTVVWVDTTQRKVFACATPTCVTPVLLGAGTNSVTIEGSTVTWAAGETNLIVSSPLTGGGTPNTLASSFRPTDPLGDGNFLWYRDLLSYKIYRCPKAGCGGTAQTFSENERGGRNLVADNAFLYWATSDAVRRKAK